MENKEEYEIDLAKLIASFFKLLGNAIRTSINYLFTIKYWIIALTIVGAISGVLYYKFKKPSYQNELIVRSNSISSFEAIHQVSNWVYNTSLSEKSKGRLIFVRANHLLDIDNDGFWDIKQDYMDINSTDTILITQRDPKYFLINIYMEDTMYLNSIKQDIFNQFSKTKIVKWNNIRINNLKEMSRRLQYELNIIDSLKEREYFDDELQTSGISINSRGELVKINKSLYHTESIELLKQKQYTDSLILVDVEPFEVESDIVINVKELKSIKYYILIFIEGFLGLGLLFLIFFKLKK